MKIKRFAWGRNWLNYLPLIDKDKIKEAELSILKLGDLEGRKFLDVGCGSGIISLAARRLGAIVHSIDNDHNSIKCTIQLRRKFCPLDYLWTITENSIFDLCILENQYQIVYAAGVLHHTGDLKGALNNVATLVAPGGSLYVSIYNDQGGLSRLWRKIKWIYSYVPCPLKNFYVAVVMAPREFLLCLLIGPVQYLKSWKTYKKRGMSKWHDMVDWVGGYPFECAKPEDIFNLFREKGFNLCHLKTCGSGIGCNEYLFKLR